MGKGAGAAPGDELRAELQVPAKHDLHDVMDTCLPAALAQTDEFLP
jgi:hypothetical protein